MLFCFLLFIIGIFAGISFGLLISLIRRPKVMGCLRIEQSDPDGPYMFLELHEKLETLADQKAIILAIRLDDYVPRK